MTAVKTFAIGLLVIGAAVQAASAGPFSGDISWTGWNAGTGLVVENTATASPFNNVPAVPEASSQIVAAVASAPTAPASAPAAVSAPINVAAPTGRYDAFVNLGSAPFPDASNLTMGGAPQGWAASNSASVLNVFGGHPTAQQQADFNSAVLQRVEQTFQLAGVHVNLTDNPNAQAAHTLSVVSNTTSAWGPLLGLTNIGGNGFDFIDQAAKSANSVDQLEWLVAHNVSHELMLAFGVGENYDKSGQYIDAEMANLGMMVNPTATFSQGAAAALLASGSLGSNGSTGGAFAQQVSGQPVPEPTTIAVWAFAAIGVVVVRRNRSRLATA